MESKSIIRHSVFILLSLFVLTACSEGKEAKPSSIGQPSEVVLILGRGLPDTDVTDSLVALLTQNVPMLNQGEDFFRMSKIPISMDNREFLKLHSRVVVKLNPKIKEATMNTVEDRFATPQLEVQIEAPSLNTLRTFVSTHKEQICDAILDHQLSTTTSYLKSHHSQQVATDVKKVFGYSILAPEEIRFTKVGKNFVWGSSRSDEKQLNMVFYSVPYTGQDLLDEKVLATLRDSVLKANIPGSQPNQWMETVWEKETPIVMAQQKTINGLTLTDFRGLWQMRNGAMGGPFVSLVQLDKQQNRIIVAEGFVYSPSTSKRDLVRTLESSLRTFSK